MTERGPSLLDRLVRFGLEQKLVVALLGLILVGWTVRVAPFDWEVDWMPRDPVAVDAIPDLGENQQIVFTNWPGRSPQDVEDQVTYPLTVSLLGVPGVRTVRSLSMFGFSTIYVIFEEGVDFYWSRSRVLEKLSSLPGGTLPDGVQPALGPDATALGQVFWYTLEGRDPDGKPTGGWDLHELRSVQDWIVRYALASAEGISEIASVGGFVQEYQVDVDPDAMRAHGVALQDVFDAVRMSNLDVGARTIEVNRVEYVIRGVGFVESLEDLERTVVKETDEVPIYVKDVGHVVLGPALRRGALDKEGAEAVGGVAVVRFGHNPLKAIHALKGEVERISPGLPSKVLVDDREVSRDAVDGFARAQGFDAFLGGDGSELDQESWLAWLRRTPRAEWPSWITHSQVAIVPFYDRTGLIHETLATLNDALFDEILVTIIVVILMVMHLRSSLLVSGLLPLAVGGTFVLMKLTGVDANVVALSGIAIAIGTMVDMGIVITENVLRHLDEADLEESRLEVVYRATSEVASAVMTAVATTVVGFLPVFAMTGAEGKLFTPLAFTKTYALVVSVLVAVTVLPPAAYMLIARRGPRPGGFRRAVHAVLAAAAVVAGFLVSTWVGLAAAAVALWLLLSDRVPARFRRPLAVGANLLAVGLVLVLLADHWMPLGPGAGTARNLVFAGLPILGLVAAFWLVQREYGRILSWCLEHKALALLAPLVLVLFGASVWLGFGRVFGFVPAALDRAGGGGEALRETVLWTRAEEALPGLGKEFMPRLDEGSFLFMPSTMAHASIGESLEVLQLQDRAIAGIPEVETVVGKIGRVESALDPAPIGMVETVVRYASEYATDESGRIRRFAYEPESGAFLRDEEGRLVPDEGGRPYRQWREHIRSPDDIWREIADAGSVPGSTSAPYLQPIAARLVMLQSGMRAPMGVKVMGPDLETIERVGLGVERLLKEAPGVKSEAVVADRIVGKPYLEIELDREALARYGLHVRSVQEVIEVAIGGKPLTTTVEGRERYPVRVRYPRERRGDVESLGGIVVPARSGAQIPLSQLADIRFVRGPQAIKSEDTRLVGYVIFDGMPGWAEVEVVESARDHLAAAVERGELEIPPGVSYRFAGSYENQVRAQRTLSVVLPLALAIIFLLLHLQFREVTTTLIVWSGVIVAWAGGFLLIWLYGQPWFLDFEVFGRNLRELFQVGPVNLSVAVWVGFLALFGIATDDGVIMATYLRQSFARERTESVAEIRAATILAGRRRVRPCLMTTATTLLALLPVMTSTGRGSDIMVPMAIPVFGGMLVEVGTMFVVPILYTAVREARWRTSRRLRPGTAPAS